MQLGGVVVDTVGAGLQELVGAVPAAQEADREHLRAAGGEEIPDGVADDITVTRLDAEGGGAGEEQVGLGLRTGDVAAVDHDHVVGHLERSEGAVDLGTAPRGGDPMDDPARAEPCQQLDRARQRPALRQQLLEDPAVAGLDRLGLLRRQLASDLASDRAREQAAAHPDPAVDPPAVDRHPLVGKRALPREDMGVDRVDQGAVEVEDQSARHGSLHPESFAITCLICV